MAQSSNKNNDCLPKRPDTKASNLLMEMINKLPKMSSISPSQAQMSPKNKSISPAQKRTRKKTVQKSNLNSWLSKQDLVTDSYTKENSNVSKSKKPKSKLPDSLQIKTSKVEKTNKDDSKKSRKSSKPTLSRFNSSSSDELPTFKEKVTRKRPKQTESFKKYGVIVPSLADLLKDQKDLSKYRIHVEEAQTLEEPSFKLHLSPQKSNESSEESWCDCKHLAIKEITNHFNNNIKFLQEIIDGKRFSDRHKRYFDKKNEVHRLTTKDLTYSTTTIVFSFEQLDHLISLMQNEFDPEDNKTEYFFKVLVPELCLKIFMETHDMTKREAMMYLDKRPVD